MTITATSRAVAFARFTHALASKTFADFPADKALFQPSPTDNHMLWHMGHLAVNYDWFASAIDGKSSIASKTDYERFGMGSKPVSDPAAYPSLPDVRRLYDTTWQRFIAAAESLSEADATRPACVESHGFLADRLDAVNKAAWHDGWHAGQVSGLRKALGLKGVI